MLWENNVKDECGHRRCRSTVSICFLCRNEKCQLTLVPTKYCRIQELQFEQTALSEPHSRRECWHLPASWVKGKSLPFRRHRRRPQNGTIKKKSSFAVLFLSGSLVVRTRTLSKEIARFPSLAWRTPARSNVRKAVTMPALFFQSKVPCQQFLAAHSVKGSLHTTENLLAVRKSAEVFVRHARAFYERQMGKLLAPLWGAAHKLVTNSFQYTAGIQAAPVVDRKNASVSIVDKLSGFSMPISRLSWSMAPMFSKSTKKRSSLVSPMQNWRCH